MHFTLLGHHCFALLTFPAQDVVRLHGFCPGAAHFVEAIKLPSGPGQVWLQTHFPDISFGGYGKKVLGTSTFLRKREVRLIKL